MTSERSLNADRLVRLLCWRESHCIRALSQMCTWIFILGTIVSEEEKENYFCLNDVHSNISSPYICAVHNVMPFGISYVNIVPSVVLLLGHSLWTVAQQ